MRFGHLDVFNHDTGGQIFFSLVQCKAAEAVSGEGGDAAWSEGAQRLQDYLAVIHGTRPELQRTGVYGAVAMGPWVTFYKYDDEQQGVQFWRPDHADPLHIDHDCVAVQDALDGILANHRGGAAGAGSTAFRKMFII